MPSVDRSSVEQMTRDQLVNAVMGLVAYIDNQPEAVETQPVPKPELVTFGNAYQPRYIYRSRPDTGKRCQGCGAVVTGGQDIGWAPASKNIWHLGCIDPGTVLEDRRTEQRHLLVR